jgi:5-methylcytosine-specific restriction protein A
VYVLKVIISRILAEYLSARKEDIASHAIARLLQHDLPNILKELIENKEQYKFEGSAGKGNWAYCPWVAVFDVLITETAQSGYYLVYLFRQDMKGVYLSLNQGVTEVRNKYKGNPKEVLRIRADDFRAQLGSLPTNFSEIEIDLAVSTSSELAAFYEVGNICAVYYDAAAVPDELHLARDFRDMMKLYELLSYNENVPLSAAQQEDDEDVGSVEIEDLRKLRQHKRIERNAHLSRKAKNIHGFICQACGFNFEEVYGVLGEHYIEAHHLVPICALKGKVVRLDPRRDFAVLCANCHRMIHRFSNPENVEAFGKIIEESQSPESVA